jgi:hypothetical protein
MTTFKNKLITDTELNTILLDLEQSKKEGLNSYELYITLKKTEESKKKDKSGNPLAGIERHHIIPKFDGDPSFGGMRSQQLMILKMEFYLL